MKMKTAPVFPPAPLTRRQPVFSFRRTPLSVAMLAGFALMGASPLYAADEQEVEALKAEIYRLRQELAAQRGEIPGTPVSGAPAEAAAPAAQSQPEEPQALDAVVVRSRNRIERLQDVPLSVSVVTGRELDRLASNDISEIVQRVGNVSWNRGNQRTYSLSIRGLGKAGQTEAQDPSIGLIVDGVSYAYNALASSFNFHDIEAVEVTRGPQGTLLGKNTSLGVINFVTRKPSFTPSADYSLLFGERDRVVGKFAAGGAIVDGLLAYRLSAVGEKGNGDIKNRSNKDMSYQNIERFSGRAQFLFTPTPDFNARLSFEVTPRSAETTNGRTTYTPTTGLRYANNGNPWAKTNGERAFTDRTNYFNDKNYSINDYYREGYVNADSARGLVTGGHGASAELNWQVGSHTLTSITAYRDYHFNAVNDEGTPYDIQRNSGGFWNDYKQTSQEFRISSDTGGFVDYQAGLYYIDVRNSVDFQRVWGHDAGAYLATNARYNRLVVDAPGRALMQDSLDNLSMSYNSPTGLQKIRNKSLALFGQANWHLSEPLTLTTGIRLTRERRTNIGSTFIRDNGSGAALNPVAVNGVQLGGFDSDGAGNLGANSAAQLALANAVAQQYFGAANYGSLTAAQKQQIADAKLTRQAAIGVVFNEAKAKPFNDIQKAFVLSPSYKINENLTTYASVQYGEKAGISQFTNGVSNKIDAEKTTSYEIGFKSALLNKTLILNANLYLTNVKDFQQSVQAYDAYTTALNNDGDLYYTAATGSVPKVQSKGIEFDGVYSGLRYTTLRFAGAYTDARYKKFENAANPAEINGAGPYRDLSGKVLPGASKFTANIGVDYRVPISGDKEFHIDFNTAYHTKYYSDNALSKYSIIKAGSITDFGIGLGARNQSYDVSLVVKNLFDDDEPLAKTATSYTPAVGRWVGIQFTGKL
ncbi:MAG: TonB-dependent receptor [Zoogloeaceae bacterium]|jgi:outer membrane receptor protein involved in Fe transport|nr:TonB-dependent receptor [Zoogloeaceae bacterium]